MRLQVQDTPRNQLHRYLNVVGKNVAARSSRPTLQWTFGVLDSEVVNAVSAPGGYVFVTRGLLRRVNNEAALAGVLSHEIAHVTHRDSFLIYQRTKVDQCKTLAYAKAGQKEGAAVLRSYGPDFVRSAISALDAFSGGPLDLNSAANAALLTLFSDQFVHTLSRERLRARPGVRRRCHRPRADGGHGLQPAGIRELHRRAPLRSGRLRPPPGAARPGRSDGPAGGQDPLLEPDAQVPLLAPLPGPVAASADAADQRAGGGAQCSTG